MCPAGYYCTSTTGEPTECADDKYSWAGSSSAGDCTDCPAGYACESKGTEHLPCEKGYYSESGDLTCTICPAGSYCSDPGSAPTAVADDKHYTEAGATF